MAAMAPRSHSIVACLAVAALGAVLWCGRAVGAGDETASLATTPFSAFPDHPAIEYSTRPPHDRVAELQRGLEDGSVMLTAGGPGQYLRSLLDTLDIPIESQLAVFSKSSVQARLISPQNPRTLFFNDSVVVGWVRGGYIEIASQDPEQGVIFYSLDPGAAAGPSLRRETRCLACHVALDSLDVPGMLSRSIGTAPDGALVPQAANGIIDHRSPFAERWSGWYVTGSVGSLRHLGNALVHDRQRAEPDVDAATLHMASLADRFETQAYLSPYSDVVALLVFAHQMHAINLLARIGWETRLASRSGGAWHLDAAARELVDYLLFVDEPPLPSPVRGTSGFAEKFSARGPRDARGRSLRQLDLQTKLMRYPCSYMIYSAAFDALPQQARDAIYARLWRVLSAAEPDARYARLARADRAAIVDILRATKPGLPTYFTRVN
jgi:hypothetical protein